VIGQKIQLADFFDQSQTVYTVILISQGLIPAQWTVCDWSKKSSFQLASFS